MILCMVLSLVGCGPTKSPTMPNADALLAPMACRSLRPEHRKIAAAGWPRAPLSERDCSMTSNCRKGKNQELLMFKARDKNSKCKLSRRLTSGEVNYFYKTMLCISHCLTSASVGGW